jgi:hypothetical protein
MAEGERREQHNHGSGTFIGGNVYGGLRQIILNTYAKTERSRPDPEDDEPPAGDYDDVLFTLGACAFLVMMTGAGVVYQVMGWPWSDDSPPPGIPIRLVATPVFVYLCLAAVAAFMARLAQILEIWSEQSAIAAVHNRGRRVARPPALMSSAMATLSATAATAAELLASLYGWSDFGSGVSLRARTARERAAGNAKAARAATRG